MADSGGGEFIQFDVFDSKQLKKQLSIFRKKYGNRSVFSEGEIVRIKSSTFRITKIIEKGLKLRLLSDEEVAVIESNKG